MAEVRAESGFRQSFVIIFAAPAGTCPNSILRMY
jgi:hypothetical protein